MIKNPLDGNDKLKQKTAQYQISDSDIRWFSDSGISESDSRLVDSLSDEISDYPQISDDLYIIAFSSVPRRSGVNDGGRSYDLLWQKSDILVLRASDC